MRHGLILIDKPAGITSHDCVARVRAALHERDVGHLGTLDPAATGLLVLAVGRKALKVVELFRDLPKEYEAQVRFGMVSTTYDGDGVLSQVPAKPGWIPPPLEIVRNTIADRFLGKIEQVPPAYSAVHVGGERAYRKMRQGRAVQIPARQVEIKECTILSYDYPVLRLRIACGSGTYIRSLAHDLGAVLHTGAYLERLRRTRVGEWRVENAVPLANATWSSIIPLKDVLADQSAVRLSMAQMQDVRCGRDVDVPVTSQVIAWYGDLPIAILVPVEGRAHARKVL